MKNTRVSIIIPTKNEEKNIERLLLSIKNQTYKVSEIIVVDNNSSDNTKKIALKHTRLVFDKGPERSAQRNYGARKSKGDYLVFLDADMELSPDVIQSAVKVFSSTAHKALIIPEKTSGNSFIAKVRRFEREMYRGDSTIEVARIFERKVFNEFGGYDESLTGAEDYDLPARIMKKYTIGWCKAFLTHHEGNLTLGDLLKKKYYYAGKSVLYADKHPELIKRQGTIIFRKAYFRNWRKFIRYPFLGISFVFVRGLVTIAAIAGYIKSAGLKKFTHTLIKMLQS